MAGYDYDLVTVGGGFGSAALGNMESRQLSAGTMKNRPACAELVRPEATVCRYCGQAFA